MAYKKKPFPKPPVFKNPVQQGGIGFRADTIDDIEIKPEVHKGRGAVSSQMSSRFERFTRHKVDDGWQREEDEEAFEEKKPQTEVFTDSSRTVIRRNDSPDIGFNQSLNPYRGCEHGCIYCFARPSHAYLGLSPGMDFETKIFQKPDAAAQLRAELAKDSYKVEPLMVGINTDAWQPIERKLEVTRSVLKVLAECNHPVNLITKSALILRDLDILAPMAKKNLVRVAVTLGTLNADLHRKLEPRAPRPEVRLKTMKGLAEAGVPVTIMVAPMIPSINDHEVEDLLEAAKEAGAKHAGFVFLRLPYELKELFNEWLQTHYPGRAAHVQSLLKQIYGGKLYDANWGLRGRGAGPYAQMVTKRFRLACDRLDFNKTERWLDDTLFIKPSKDARQGVLF